MGRRAGSRLPRRHGASGSSPATTATSARRTPSCAGWAGALRAAGAVLDGEIVAFDAHGRPSFGELQARMHVQRPGRRRCSPGCRSASWSSTCCISAAGRCCARPTSSGARRCSRPGRLTDRAGRRRRPSTGTARPRWPRRGRRGSRGCSPSGATRSTTPGRRSRSWVKVKHVRMQEVVVGGWRPGAGPPGGRHRLAAARRAGRRGPAGLRRPRRHRLLRPDARRPAGRGCGRWSAATSPFADEVPRAQARDAHWVTPAAGRRGGVRRVDARRAAAAPGLARAAPGQGGRGRGARAVTATVDR